jgi:hypothetical protein
MSFATAESEMLALTAYDLQGVGPSVAAGPTTSLLAGHSRF